MRPPLLRPGYDRLLARERSGLLRAKVKPGRRIGELGFLLKRWPSRHDEGSLTVKSNNVLLGVPGFRLDAQPPAAKAAICVGPACSKNARDRQIGSPHRRFSVSFSCRQILEPF